jgi:hypothetical protein
MLVKSSAWKKMGYIGFQMKKVSTSPNTILTLVALTLFLFSLILNWSSFFPSLGEINPWDEAGYVKSGQELLQGKLQNFAGSPLAAGLYAITNLIFSSSPFWLVHCVAAGRLIAYALIWLSAYKIGRQLQPHATPLILLFMLLTAPFYIKMLRYPSDPLFMAFAGLALAELLEFRQTQNIRTAVMAGIFTGLAAAARNDGLVIFTAALAWLVVFTVVKKINILSILGFIVPVIILVGGYVFIYGCQTGDFSLGTAERTYDNFEAGQIAVYSGEEGLNAAVDAKREARRLFGTAEENDFSVMKAILRNPQAYLQRLSRVIQELPAQIIKAYSGKWVVLLTFWAAWGVIVLIRKRQWALLGLCILWFTPFMSGFVITIFRTGHLLFPSLVVLSFGAVGLQDFTTRFKERRIRWIGLGVMLLLLVIGIIASELVVIYAVGLSVVAILLTWLGFMFLPERFRQPALPLLLFMVVGFILHGPFAGIKTGPAETSPEDQALLVMIDELPMGARVLAGSPGVIYAANMTYLGLSSTDVPIFTSVTDFSEWLVAQKVDAVYVDQSLTVDNHIYWVLLQELSGRFHVAYEDPSGETQVWIASDI